MPPYAPTPEALNWLAKGRLADRCLRAIRLWVILHLLYPETAQNTPLPQLFRYGDVRDRLFASTHSRDNNASTRTLSANCTTCCCQKTVKSILKNSPLAISIPDWKQQMSALAGLSPEQIKDILQQRPFATVHRSIRDDLTYLSELGWLENKGQGQFLLKADRHLPQMPKAQMAAASELSIDDLWEVVRSLESVAFVKPNLDIIIHSLWQQLTERTQTTHRRELAEPTQRIFIHLDYILSEAMQEQVDTLQEQIERLWQEGGGIVQFNYNQHAGRTVQSTVYPVCLHYARRAKYLSAYGQDPAGNFGWHNYRLDRITSSRLTILAWGKPQVPTPLQETHAAGTLPTSEEVSEALSQAWGFNFYLPRQLLIMRFSPQFAERYVQDTDRHATFEPIPYRSIAKLIKQEIKGPAEQATLLKILSQKNKSDRYYRAWIRLGDINIVMRLRDWRPNGEVIAPIELRQQMQEEAQQECSHYQN